MNPQPSRSPLLQLPPPGHRDWYAHEAVRAIPRLVLMADKNPYSRTYGCFDRSFWHYRTMDFPCGMNQEFVLALALAYKLEMPGNIYAGSARLRELALAGIDFAIKSSYPDGTCDDYFPYERALGALVFSLYAMSESCIELGERDERHLDFFTQRADWLATHNESGQLANHQAFAALALYNVFMLTGDDRYRDASNAFRDLTLSWQKDEGWFQEYEGADPGYHTCSIAFLAKLWQKSRDESLIEPLGRAVDFASHFMHPDGSYGGEYGSRNTYHFYPHGFEVLAPRFPRAGAICETYLQRALPHRRRYFNDDDRMAAHYVYDWMQAWRDHAPVRTAPVEPPEKTELRWFPQAKMLVARTPRYHVVVAANKGGVLKAVAPGGPIASDTGPIAELEDGRVAVTHLVDREHQSKLSESQRELHISGHFHERRIQLPSPVKMLIFRVLLLTIGRFNANLVRSLLQKKLILGKHPMRMRFEREIRIGDDSLEIRDTIHAGGESIKRLSFGTDATSIYVANSNVFQDSVLLEWTHLPESAVQSLNACGKLTVRRVIGADGECRLHVE